MNSCKKILCFLIASFFIFMSAACSRFTEKKSLDSVPVAHTGARPAVVLKTGIIPLWFRLVEEGPVLLDSIEDAAYPPPLSHGRWRFMSVFCMKKTERLFL